MLAKPVFSVSQERHGLGPRAQGGLAPAVTATGGRKKKRKKEKKKRKKEKRKKERRKRKERKKRERSGTLRKDFQKKPMDPYSRRAFC